MLYIPAKKKNKPVAGEQRKRRVKMSDEIKVRKKSTGRKPKDPAHKRSIQIPLTLLPEEYEKLSAAAGDASIAAFLRDAANEVIVSGVKMLDEPLPVSKAEGINHPILLTAAEKEAYSKATKETFNSMPMNYFLRAAGLIKAGKK